MKAYELLSSPDKWTTEVFARGDGECRNASDDDATCFCVLGALCRCYTTHSTLVSAIKKLEHHVKTEFHERSIANWNDEVGYVTVVRTLKELDL